MRSYRTDTSGKLIGFHGSKIGLIVWILNERLWGKIVIDGRLRSQSWWKNRLESLINKPAISIPPENLWEGIPAEPSPISFEIEMGIPNLNHEMLLKAWKKMFPDGN